MKASEFFKNTEPVYLKMYKELASRVGESLDSLDLHRESDGWQWPFDEHRWTKEEEEDFIEWLIDYVYKNRKKFELSYTTKAYIRRRVVPTWMLMYGWRYKGGEKWVKK